MITYNGDDITHLLGERKYLDEYGGFEPDYLKSELSDVHFILEPVSTEDHHSKDTRKVLSNHVEFYGANTVQCVYLGSNAANFTFGLNLYNLGSRGANDNNGITRRVGVINIRDAV